MQRVIIISGPTASGKTDLSYTIGKNIPTVLINADSRHVYKSLDIISGKDIPEGSVFQHSTLSLPSNWDIGYYPIDNTQFYLLDIAHPTQTFSVHDYSIVVRELLPFLSAEKVPIIVGGSNFYISSLRESIETSAIPPNSQLRDILSRYTIFQLQARLEEVDSNRLRGMNNSDIHNARRLVRAIEVAEWKRGHSVPTEKPVLDSYQILHIALTAPLDLLREKINARVDSRISHGAIKEAESLFEGYDTLSQNVRTANGYMQLFEYLTGSISYDEAIQKWKYSEYHNAKKQLTWIHGDSRIQKYSITDPHHIGKILHDILAFLERHD